MRTQIPVLLPTRKVRRSWKWLTISCLVVLIALLLTADLIIRRAEPILKGRVVETLTTRFDSTVELDELHVSVANGLEVSGGGLRIFPPDEVVAAGATEPLISVARFSFHASVRGLFESVTRVDEVRVSGLSIYIPAKEYRQRDTKSRHGHKIKIQVAEFLCEESQLTSSAMARAQKFRSKSKEPKRSQNSDWTSVARTTEAQVLLANP